MLEHITAKAMHRIAMVVTSQVKGLVKHYNDFIKQRKELPTTVKNVPRANNALLIGCKKSNYLCRYLDGMDRNCEYPPETPINRHFDRK